jgi:hypothetical protein
MNPYANIRYPNTDMMQPFMQGMQMAQHIGGQNALSQYAANPNDPEAFQGLAKFHPEKAMQVRQQQERQQQQALEQRRDDFLLGGKIFRGMQVKDEASYQAALQTYQRMGGNMQDVPTTFDPAYVQGVVQVADQLAPQKQDVAPSAVREYEYRQSLPVQQRGEYDRFRQNIRPQIFGSADGGYNVFDPNGVAGAPQNDIPTVATPQDAMRLPPGTQFRMPDGRIGTVPGGAGGNASGGFPGN